MCSCVVLVFGSKNSVHGKGRDTRPMTRYCYFAKTIGQSRYADLAFLRLAESDARVPEFTAKYNSIGFSTCISYTHTPTMEEEVFQLRMRLRAWEVKVTVEEEGGKGERLR